MVGKGLGDRGRAGADRAFALALLYDGGTSRRPTTWLTSSWSFQTPQTWVSVASVRTIYSGRSTRRGGITVSPRSMEYHTVRVSTRSWLWTHTWPEDADSMNDLTDGRYSGT